MCVIGTSVRAPIVQQLSLDPLHPEKKLDGFERISARRFHPWVGGDKGALSAWLDKGAAQRRLHSRYAPKYA